MVRAALSLRYPELDVRREIIHTTGDRRTDAAGGRGPRFRHRGQGNLHQGTGNRPPGRPH
ncbi:MAG: hypothetical protein ACLT8E_09010 [Akkermansia sp.]